MIRKKCVIIDIFKVLTVKIAKTSNEDHILFFKKLQSYK